MRPDISYRLLLAPLGLLLLFFAACGSQPTVNAGTSQAQAATTTTVVSTNPAVANTTPGNQQAGTSAAMPHTETSCPAEGTGRAAITTPLALGSHQNIVYTYNTPNAAILRRYDVSTGKKINILSIPGVQINDAQLSTDGQFILFTTKPVTSPGAAHIGSIAVQLVRVDGQGLQTLYCAKNTFQPGMSGLYNLLWSPNQQLAIFSLRNPADAGKSQFVRALNLSNGQVQTEINTAIQITTGPMNNYRLYGWLNNTQVYMADDLNTLEIGGLDKVKPYYAYILDLSKGPDQKLSIMPVAKLDSYCWSLGSVPDGSRLLISMCQHNPPGTAGSSITHGPGTLSVQPQPASDIDTGRTDIYKNSTGGVTAASAISNSTLLFDLHFGDGAVNRDELWKINIDGTKLTRLTPLEGSITQQYTLNTSSQSPWSNVSRDNSMFAAQSRNGSPTTNLCYGSLSGGDAAQAPTVFATATQDEGTLEIAGWTTM
jgi:hypothetical protein